jgi:hypothetical protein
MAHEWWTEAILSGAAAMHRSHYRKIILLIRTIFRIKCAGYPGGISGGGFHLIGDADSMLLVRALFYGGNTEISCAGFGIVKKEAFCSG